MEIVQGSLAEVILVSTELERKKYYLQQWVATTHTMPLGGVD